MDILAIVISAIAVISGAVLGWSGRSRTIKQDTAADAGRDARLQTGVDAGSTMYASNNGHKGSVLMH